MSRLDPSRVVLLDPLVVGQIAAGEVIERPASVLRELLDNALDAGATQIEVEVEGAGRRRIEVRDDGQGMEGDDLELALVRHATSKLRSIDDLFALETFGFRGEGLSSIAAVSRLTILTRARGAAMARRLQAQGGEVGVVEPAARQVGTTVEVSDLFYNTPARLKFLKSKATELAHLQDILTRSAMAAPTVRFTLLVEGRRVLELAPARSRIERVQALWGSVATPHTARRGAQSLTVEVFVADLAESRSSARGVQALVNQRPVRDRLLSQAVTRGCGARLPARRFPRAVVFVECDPELVDVNVHPQKHEVRFADPAGVFSLVAQAVAVALGEEVPAAAGVPRPSEAAPAPAPARVYALGGAASPGPGAYQDHHRRLEVATQRFWSAQQQRAAERGLDYGLGAALARARPLDAMSDQPTLLGRSGAGVLICEAEGTLLLVSEQAALRELAKRSLRAPGEGVAPPSRALEHPFAFEPRDPLRWRAGVEAFRRLGFDLEDFGGGDWVLRAIPPQLSPEEKELRAILEELDAGLGGGDAEAAAMDVLVRHVVRRGAPIPPEEIVRQLGGSIVAQSRSVSVESGLRGASGAAECLALRLAPDSLTGLLELDDG